MANFRDEQLVDRNAAVKRIVKIAPLDTDYPLTPAKREQPFVGETLEADENAARPTGFLVQLAMKSMEFSRAYPAVEPLRFDQVGLAREIETAVDLFAR